MGRNIHCSIHRLAIYDIFQLLPQTIQVAVFSATMPPDALEITRKPVRILVKEDELTLQCIKQFYGQCGEGSVEAVLPSMTISTYLGYYPECYLCEHQRKVDNKIRGRDHRFCYTWTHGLEHQRHQGVQIRVFSCAHRH